MSKVHSIEGCVNFTRGGQTTWSGIGSIIDAESRLLGIRPAIGFCKFVGICKVVSGNPGAAAGTLHIEQSVDGTNWDLAQTFNMTPASATLSFSIELNGLYVRARFSVPSGENYTIRFGGFLDPIGGSSGSSSGGAVLVQGEPGTTITTQADTAVGTGATVALPTTPAGTRRVTVQNTGPSGTLVRVRPVGAPAGSGFILPRFASCFFGGADGAVQNLEVQEVASPAVATTINVIFERD